MTLQARARSVTSYPHHRPARLGPSGVTPAPQWLIYHNPPALPPLHCLPACHPLHSYEEHALEIHPRGRFSRPPRPPPASAPLANAASADDIRARPPLTRLQAQHKNDSEKEQLINRRDSSTQKARSCPNSLPLRGNNSRRWVCSDPKAVMTIHPKYGIKIKINII